MASLRSDRETPERRLEPDGTMRNGIDLDVLNGAVDQIREQPATAAIKIRTRHLWNDGYAVDGFAEEVEGADGVTKRSFKFRTDWPEEIGGDDSGPSPGEALLGALGGCVAMTYISKAAARGVDIEALEVTIEGEVDLRGVFEVDFIQAALSKATVTVAVGADVDDATLAQLAETTQRTSAVYDSLANPVPMQLLVRRLPKERG